MIFAPSQVRFQRRLTRAIALPIVLLLFLAGVSIWQITRLLSALQWVDHTNEVISQANYTQKLLLDAETGLRGYQLTGQRDFLAPYQEANTTIETNLEILKELVSDNPTQAARVDNLASQFREWNQQIPAAIARRQRGESEPLTAIENRKLRMDHMRQDIDRFIATEEYLREQRSEVARRTTRAVILTSLILAAAVGVLLSYFIRRQILQVSKTYEDALQTAQLKTEELEKSAIALQRSAQRLAALHDIDRAILAAETDETLIADALTRLRVIVPHQQSFVAVFNREDNTAHIRAGSSQTGDLSHPVGTQLIATDFALNQASLMKTRYTENLATLEVSPPLWRQLRSHGFGSCLCVPLLVEERLIGELNLASTRTAAFEEEAQSIIHEVAAQLAIALQQTRLRTQLQEYTTQLEQRVAERTAELQDINQELETFTYSVSHDLRAPLRTIQGFATALLEDCSHQMEDFCKAYIESIIDDAMQMNGLINDLLNYSRLTRTQIQLQTVPLDSVVQDAISQLATQIQDKQAVIAIAAPLPQVIAHRTTLVQVITNLLGNAIKFTEANIQPQIDIFAIAERQDDQDWIRLWIVDNGIGIAPEHQERIFRVFERLHGIENYPGTGIGLAIVRKGLERMGGHVGVESQLGQGSRFWIALPSPVPVRNTP